MFQCSDSYRVNVDLGLIATPKVGSEFSAVHVAVHETAGILDLRQYVGC